MNSLLCWSVTLLNLHSNKQWRLSKVRTGWPYRWFWKFFWKSTRASMVLTCFESSCNLSCNDCAILHFVRGLYGKHSASYYSFSSDVGYKKNKRLVCTHQDILARICKTCRTQKIRSDLFSKNLFSTTYLLWSRAIIALKCDRRWLLFFGCTYKGYINSIQN